VPHAWKNTSAETGRVLFLYTPAKAGGFFEERLRRPEELDPNGAEANQMRRRYGWDIIGPPPLWADSSRSGRTQPPRSLLGAGRMDILVRAAGLASCRYWLASGWFPTPKLAAQSLRSTHWSAGPHQIGAHSMTDNDKPDSNSRYWRYQAVRVDYPAYPDDPEYLVIEVCLSRANNRLCSWSAEPASKRPSGDTYAELLDDLMRMLQDAREWKPVAFDDLRVGMRFERAEVTDSARRGFE
jgi:hypothetical protein